MWLAFVGEYVDEIVRRVHGHWQLFANRNERLVVEEHAVIVDRFSRNEREIEVAPILERTTNVRAGQETRGRRRGTEERILAHDQLERRAGLLSQLLEQLRHQGRHRDACDDADALPFDPW